MIKINDRKINFEKFPNGETKVPTQEIVKALITQHRANQIMFKYENDSDLIKLYMVKECIKRLQGKNIPLFLTVLYFPYSRMDRTENYSAFTLKYITDFINQMKFDEVVIYEPHSDVAPALVNNSVSLSLISQFMIEVVEDTNFNNDLDYIVYPDATANKRYSFLNPKNHLTGLKHRDFNTGRITSLELAGKTPKEGFKAILVDDLCSYGGTFILTAQKLKEMGASEIYLFVGHCEDSIFEGKIFETDLIDKVYTTNSLLTKQDNWSNIKYKDQLQIFDVEKVLVSKNVTLN